MALKLLKKHLKENGKEYYEEVVANHNRVIENQKKPSLLSAASLKKSK